MYLCYNILLLITIFEFKLIRVVFIRTVFYYLYSGGKIPPQFMQDTEMHNRHNKERCFKTLHECIDSCVQSVSISSLSLSCSCVRRFVRRSCCVVLFGVFCSFSTFGGCSRTRHLPTNIIHTKIFKPGNTQRNVQNAKCCRMKTNSVLVPFGSYIIHKSYFI